MTEAVTVTVINTCPARLRVCFPFRKAQKQVGRGHPRRSRQVPQILPYAIQLLRYKSSHSSPVHWGTLSQTIHRLFTSQDSSLSHGKPWSSYRKCTPGGYISNCRARESGRDLRQNAKECRKVVELDVLDENRKPQEASRTEAKKMTYKSHPLNQGVFQMSENANVK